LAAAFALALIVGGAVFWAMLFGWDTLLIDYMVFFLISAIFLGGTLSYGQKRAEARGETLDDADQGWPGPWDLALLGIAALLITCVAMFSVPPAVVDASPPARATLSMQPPGFRVLATYLEHQLNQPMPITQFAAGAVLAMLSVWGGYDLGMELSGKRGGRLMIVMTCTTALLMLLSGSYDVLLGVAFALAFVIFALRYTRQQYPIEACGAGLMLGAALLAQWQVFLVLVVGYAAALVVLMVRQRSLRREAWAIMVLGVPLVAMVATAPWWVWR
jgi:hypothetical protein